MAHCLIILYNLILCFVDHTAAGYWGDYNDCDTPTWTVEALLQHLKENETVCTEICLFCQ